MISITLSVAKAIKELSAKEPGIYAVLMDYYRESEITLAKKACVTGALDLNHKHQGASLAMKDLYESFLNINEIAERLQRKPADRITKEAFS